VEYNLAEIAPKEPVKHSLWID